MAYIYYHEKWGWLGPFANKTGEWVGNSLPDNIDPNGSKKGFLYNASDGSKILVYEGKAGTTGRFSAEDLKARGFVGLYLSSDRKIPEAVDNEAPRFVEIDTDELTESVISGEQEVLKPCVFPFCDIAPWPGRIL